MATNRKRVLGRQINLTVAAGILSGQPCIVGNGLTGVALYDADATNNKTTVDTEGVYNLSVKAVDDAGSVAVAAGDMLFYNVNDATPLSKKASGFFFGLAIEAITAGSTATIMVKLEPAPGPGALDLSAFADRMKSLNVRNNSGGTFAAGQLVYISGWDETNKRFTILQAAANGGSDQRAQFILKDAILTATNGVAYKATRLTALNANSGTVGDPVYLDTTAGGWTQTKPSGTNTVAQIVGRLAVKSATVGEIEFDLEATATGTGAGMLTNTAPTITAFATGGQASATALTNNYNVVSVCATAGDSVKLPTAIAGLQIEVKNEGAASCNVFGNTGATINGGSANGSIDIPPTASLIFTATSTTAWHTRVATTSAAGVAALNGFTLSPRNIATLGAPAIITTQGADTATGATTEVYWAEITVPANVSSTGVAFLNGSAVAGNIIGYLYDSTGAFVAKTASTGQSGTAAFQQIAWVGGPIAVKGPATYYIGLAGDTTGGTQKSRMHVYGNGGAAKITGQVYATQPATNASNAPTTFTANLGPVASLY